MTEQTEIKQVSIKKKRSPTLYWGMSETTGELLSINAVPRGRACNCICPACGTSLIAHKGEIVAHHFAHETNNECYYGAELSIYRAFYDYLKKHLEFFLPDAILKFDSYKKAETIRTGYLIKLTDVILGNDSDKYPPLLLCIAGENKFQLVLNIDNYYSENDIKTLAEEGRNANTAVVIVDIESVDTITSTNDISTYIEGSNNKSWVFNRLVDIWDQRFREAAVVPKTFNSGYLCPAQKKKFHNVYSSRWEDCVHCEYCYSCKPEILCLAHKYISHIADFKQSLDDRKQAFEKDNHIKPIKKIDEYKCPKCGAPMRRKPGKLGVFAGCSRFPECKGTRQVEPHTEQVIIFDKKKW